MKHIQLILLLLITILASNNLLAQKKEFKKADKAYKLKNYSEAIKFYEAGLAIKSNLAKKVKLAKAYYHINKVEKSENILREVVKDPKAKPKSYFAFGETLMSAGKYKEAKYWFQQYKNKVPDDKKVDKKIADCDKVNEIKSFFPNMEIAAFPHNSEMDDIAPFIWKGQIIFSSDRNQGVKILKKKSGTTGRDYIKIYASKENEDFSYSSPKGYSSKINELNKNSSNISINKEGTLAVFSRNNKVANKKNIHTIQLYQASSSDGNKWKNVELISFCNPNYNYMHPALSPDGQRLFFVSDKGGGQGGTDIYVSHKKKNGEWGRPENLGPIVNTSSNDGFPFIDSDGKLYFCSKGHSGLGGFDIFISFEDTDNNNWYKPINVGTPINSSYDDVGLFIDNDTRRGAFSSSRDGGDDDIFLCWMDGLPEGVQLKIKEDNAITDNSGNLPSTSDTTAPVETSTSSETPTSSDKIKHEEEVNNTSIENTIATAESSSIGAKDPVVTDNVVETVPQTETPPTTTNTNAVKDNASIITETVDTKPKNTTTTSPSIESNTTIETPKGDAKTTVTNTVKTTSSNISSSEETVLDNTEKRINTTTNEPINTENTVETTTPIIGAKNNSSSRIVSTEALLVRKTQGDDVIDQVGINPTADNPILSMPDRSGLGEATNIKKLSRDLKNVKNTKTKVYRLNDMNYEPNVYILTKEQENELKKLVKIFIKHPEFNFEIACHTYSVGDDTENLRLSANRAIAIKNFLTANGVAADQVYPTGYGERYIINHCENGIVCTQAEHNENERVEIRVITE